MARRAKEKRKGKPGHPDFWRPEYNALVIKLGKQGYSDCQMAAYLGVARVTMRTRWLKNHPDFAQAYAIAKTFAQAFWEKHFSKLALTAGRGAGPKVSASSFLLSRRFRNDYHEKFMQEIATPEDDEETGAKKREIRVKFV